MRTGSLFVTLFALGCAASHAQTTAFNYQGQLNEGTNAATGIYDLQFTVYDALSGGNARSVRS